MQHLYVRAPGPGAIIALLNRFAGSDVWEVSITPADARTGYRCVTLNSGDSVAFAGFLTECLQDTVYVLAVADARFEIIELKLSKNGVDVARCSLHDKALPSIPFLRDHSIKNVLKQLCLPLWVTNLNRLKSVPYETIRVLDQRDLLVEAPDVIYTAQADIAD